MEEKMEEKPEPPQPEETSERRPKLHFRDLRRLAKSHIYKDVSVNKAELQEAPKIANVVEMMLKSMSQEDSEEQCNGQNSKTAVESNNDVTVKVQEITSESKNATKTEPDDDNAVEEIKEQTENTQQNNNLHISQESGENKAVISNSVEIEQAQNIEGHSNEEQLLDLEEQREVCEDENETKTVQEGEEEAQEEKMDNQEESTQEQTLDGKVQEVEKDPGAGEKAETTEAGGEDKSGPRASRTCSIL